MPLGFHQGVYCLEVGVVMILVLASIGLRPKE
ncbi:hypothetical protein FHW06_000610 [Pantoea agglomerans]